MLKYLRYALATFCFAASVGCLALWWWSTTSVDRFFGPSYFSRQTMYVECCMGNVSIGLFGENMDIVFSKWFYRVDAASVNDRRNRDEFVERNGQFELSEQFQEIDFPLWYPALVLALTGFASVRLGRRFTLRSAIIATTVVAGLLGMAVGL